MNILSASMAEHRLLIYHETDGRKYFRLLDDVSADLGLALPQYRNIVVVKRLAKDLVRRQPGREAIARFANNLPLRLSSAGRRGEVVVAGLPPFDLRVGRLLALARHNRVIYHNSWHDWGGDFQPRRYGPLTKQAKALWRRFLSHPNVETVAVTPLSQKGLADFAGRETHLIPHAVEEGFYLAAREALDPPGPIRLLYVGYLEERKGVPLVLDLAARLGVTAQVVLAGDGPLRRDVEAAQASGQVTYLGPIGDRRRMMDVFGQADLLLAPSKRTAKWEELFGRVIVEAFASGAPVFASDHVGPRLLIQPGINGELFAEDDIAAYATKIEALAADRVRLGRMADAARASAAPYADSAVFDLWRALIARNLAAAEALR